MTNQKIGSFISTLRKEKNLTQEQLAEKLGVSNRSVSRWENGNTLPDLSLMYCICNVLDITMSELLNGARQDGGPQRKDTLLLVLELSDREKQAKKKKLNWWFALGLASLLAAFPASLHPSSVHMGIWLGLGLVFHAAGFYHNNQDRPLTAREKAVLTAPEDELKMRFADEMIQFSKKLQKVNTAQYKTAFQKITENLAEQEHVAFCMVADDFSVNGNPGPWHAGIAVTERQVFLCGEAMSGLVMTHSELIRYERHEIRSVKYANRGIVLKTPQGTVTIRGENMKHLAEALEKAIMNCGISDAK